MKTRNEKIYNFLSGLKTDIDTSYYFDVAQSEANNFNDIFEMINDQNGFNIDVIYYSEAIKYLQENDASLSKSLGIAAECGFELQNLNSEILASLLASRSASDEFYELESEINDFFDELNENE